VGFTRRDYHETENQGNVGGKGTSRELPDLQDAQSNNILTQLSYKLSDASTVVSGSTIQSLKNRLEPIPLLIIPLSTIDTIHAYS